MRKCASAIGLLLLFVLYVVHLPCLCVFKKKYLLCTLRFTCKLARTRLLISRNRLFQWFQQPSHVGIVCVECVHYFVQRLRQRHTATNTHNTYKRTLSPQFQPDFQRERDGSSKLTMANVHKFDGSMEEMELNLIFNLCQ